jgi:hypothetical protein
MINTNVLNNVLEIIQNAVYFQVQRVDLPEVFDLFLEENFEYIGNDNIDLFMQAKEVYWLYASFKKEDFHKQVSESFGNKFIKKNNVILIKVLDDKNSKILFLQYEIDSVSNTKHKRKTLQELNLDLEEAVKKENFELAQKIKNKIELKEKVTQTRFDQ